VTTGSNASWIELLVDDPINETVHRRHARTQRTKGRIEILVAKSIEIFLDVAVGIDNTK
jgi:hypothetical protein